MFGSESFLPPYNPPSLSPFSFLLSPFSLPPYSPSQAFPPSCPCLLGPPAGPGPTGGMAASSGSHLGRKLGDGNTDLETWK